MAKLLWTISVRCAVLISDFLSLFVISPHPKHTILEPFLCTEAFCDEIMQVYQNDEWRLSYKKGSSQPLSNRVPKEIFDQVVESVSDMENLPDWSQR